MERKKYGWTAAGIVGFIFTPIGLLFAVLGTVLGKSASVTWQRPDDRGVFLACFCGIGGLFLLIGLVLLFLDFRRRHLLRRAYNGGNCVDAQILGVTVQGNVNMLNGHPHVVECAWTAPSGVVHVYRSRYLYTDVTKLLKTETVPVYIDRDDENIGFVDIDAVLPEIRSH